MSFIQHDARTAEGLSALRLFDLSDDVAGPILAGLRAQAIASLCEKLDLPAILIDGLGRVLHIAPGADKIIAGEISTVADHLLGGDEQAKRRIEALLVATLADEASGRGVSVSLSSRSARAPLILTAIRADTASAHQILKAVVVATRGAGVDEHALLEVCAALDEA